MIPVLLPNYELLESLKDLKIFRSITNEETEVKRGEKPQIDLR